MRKIKHTEVLGLIVSKYRKSVSSKFVDELPAIVSHWLQDIGSNPILLGEKYRKMWSEDLREYAGEVDYVIVFDGVPFPPTANPKFKFIDLFAGIGGFRIALQKLDGKCVFSSDWDKAAKKTYFENFGEVPFGDIKQFTKLGLSDAIIGEAIPDHDILAAGFPCQPFSRAGVSARVSLGKSTGFDDEKQGNLFFDIVRMAKVKKPKILFLENVKNLQSHDKGKTFRVIMDTIKKKLGYSFSPKVIDASRVVPQKRQRCYMVCYRDKKEFSFPEFTGKQLPLKSILEKQVPEQFTISDKLWLGHKNRTQRNIDRGTGFTAFEANLEKPANTLVARYGKDGKECLVPQKGKNPRKLTPRECARLLGFPDEFKTAGSNAASYRQFGNSVVVPVVESIAKRIVKDL